VPITDAFNWQLDIVFHEREHADNTPSDPSDHRHRPRKGNELRPRLLLEAAIAAVGLLQTILGAGNTYRPAWCWSTVAGFLRATLCSTWLEQSHV